MRLASLLLALPQAEAGPDNEGACTAYVVESGCSKESKSCKALFKKEDLPKGQECSTPQKGELKGLCYIGDAKMPYG